MYYNQLCSDKAAMEVVSLNRRKQSQLLGVLFAEYEILTTEQASMIRDQMKRPQQVFANSDSLWAFYNFVTNALQSSHPKTWMEDQRILHYFIGTICDFSAPVQPISAPATVVNAPVDPLTTNYGEPENQTNLLVQIAEVTGDESVLEPQLSDNQVVQDETICADDLHQSEEIIEDTNEAEENVLTEDELAHELYGVDNDIEVSIPGPCAAHDVETEREIQQENSEDVFPQEEPEYDSAGFTLEDRVIEHIQLNENTVAAVEVIENAEDPDEDVFAEADNFDLDFTDDTKEDTDSIPDFF